MRGIHKRNKGILTNSVAKIFRKPSKPVRLKAESPVLKIVGPPSILFEIFEKILFA